MPLHPAWGLLGLSRVALTQNSQEGIQGPGKDSDFSLLHSPSLHAASTEVYLKYKWNHSPAQSPQCRLCLHGKAQAPWPAWTPSAILSQALPPPSLHLPGSRSLRLTCPQGATIPPYANSAASLARFLGSVAKWKIRIS